jgi:NAD(P)-dependent dehydrogenase (short-subunit alcohol dehydrogenase family)
MRVDPEEHSLDLKLQDKIAIVTGASKGIGRAIAISLAQEGCNLTINARDEELLAQTADVVRGCGRQAAVVAADLRQGSERLVVDRAIESYGRLDIVVNCAGATKRGDFFTLSDADFTDGFALKFFGYVRMTRAAWPHLIKTSGAVVNIIGAGGRHAMADFTIGGSVNAALMNFTKAMAHRGQKDGVRVNAINPGPIESDRLWARIKTMMAASNVSESDAMSALLSEEKITRFGKPEEVARLACYLASNASAFMQGSLVDIDGGFSRTI